MLFILAGSVCLTALIGIIAYFGANTSEIK